MAPDPNCANCGGTGTISDDLPGLDWPCACRAPEPDHAILRELDAFTRHRKLDPETSVDAAQGVDVKGDTLLWLTALAEAGPNAEYSADEVAHLSFYGKIDYDLMADANRVDSLARRSSTLFGKNAEGEEIFTPWIERTGEKRDGKHLVRITDEGWRQWRMMKREERDAPRT